ncbi:hypothetical protein [Nocardioides stalactiti]|uniref:hypothetical protein n=1 Tax=Nocardioides stalactiti TaxID=2755356 RepID=UPI0015FFCD39|nr:hypothetical protein [Nocardioides stalactiti]
MGTTVVYDLIDTLYERWTALLEDTVTVFDGDGLDDSGDNFLMVGWDDPDNDRGNSAEARQAWHGLGAQTREEEGTLTCLLICCDGGNDITTARAAAKQITDLIEADLRSDPSLGNVVTGLQWVGYGTRSDLKQWLSDRGAVAQLVFEIAFKARI